MPAKIIERVVADLRTRSGGAVRAEAAPLGDAALVEAFVARRDEAAFAALVQRHGPMVLGVCRRILGHAQDAEDAFQAVFWVLSRKAGGIRPRGWVGNWLYGVAVRTAKKARGLRRRRREHQVDAMPPELLPSPTPPSSDTDRDAQAILDEEIERLPDKYRLAVVLCELEGRGRKEAAAQLGIPEGTLSSRLAYARRLLAGRLQGRGITLGGGVAALLGENGAQAAVSHALLTTTIQSASAAGPATAAAASLAKGVMTAMLLGKLKKMAAVMVICAAALGIGLGVRSSLAAQEEAQGRAGAAEQKTPAPAEQRTAKTKSASVPAEDSILGTWRLLRVDWRPRKDGFPSADPELYDDVAGKATVHITRDRLHRIHTAPSALFSDTRKIRIGPGTLDVLSAADGAEGPTAEKPVLATYKLDGNRLHLYFADGFHGVPEAKSRPQGPKDAAETWTLVRLPSRQEIYQELDRLQGRWNAVAGEFRGQALLPRELESVRLLIEADRWYISAPEETAQPDAVPRTLFDKRMRFVLETTGKRDYIVLKVENKTASNNAFVLYELRGDELKVCWDAGWSLPADAAAQFGGGANLGAPMGGFGNLGAAPMGNFGNLGGGFGGGAPGGFGGLGDGGMNITPMEFKTTFSSKLVLFTLKRHEPMPPKEPPAPGAPTPPSPNTMPPLEGTAAPAPVDVKTQILVAGPQGMKVRLFEDKQDKTAPARFTFATPGTYRLRLSNIPDRPGKVYYPTIEIPPVTAPHAAAFLANSFIPLEFADFDAADRGAVATIYGVLPDNEDAPDAPDEARVEFRRVRPAAVEKMIVLAIIRLGGIDLEADEMKGRPPE